MRTFGTLFSGGGGVDMGLMAAGLTPLWAVEYDADIAAVYRQNIGDHMHVADVRSMDYNALEPVDWLHASPVCTNASVANPNGKESETDIATAKAVVRAIDAIRPQVFTLENVWGYRDYASFRLILNALGEEGYFYDFEHVNAADFGVPQTRKRLILRASRGLLPALPQPVPWVGWYAAIADLVPTLPDSKLAPWQLARLPDELANAVLVPGLLNDESSSMTTRNGDAPAITVTTSHNQRDLRAVLESRVVAMTPRCLARFQSVPDWYVLPDKRALAAKIIGNMVPPLLMQRVAEQLQEYGA